VDVEIADQQWSHHSFLNAPLTFAAAATEVKYVGLVKRQNAEVFYCLAVCHNSLLRIFIRKENITMNGWGFNGTVTLQSTAYTECV